MAYRPEITKIISDQDRTEKVDVLKKFIETAAADYRKEGIPVDTDGRIDMRVFHDSYPDVQKDEANVKMWREEEFSKDTAGQSENPSMRDGERLEMLIHAILYKNLHSKYIVVRSSHFDDIHNKVDNVLFDRETGSPICALDEVGDIKGARFETKQAAVRDRNLGNGGASLKYGLKLKNENGKITVVPGAIANIPVFYVALPHDRIEKGVREFIPSATEQSEFEKKLFEYFLQATEFQIHGLELYSGRLDQNLKNRLAVFKKALVGLKKQKQNGS